MNLPHHLSASAINRFFQCPFSKYCEYQKYPKILIDRKAADFGICVHSLITDYYRRISNSLSIEDLVETIEVAFYEGGNYATSSLKKKYERVQSHFTQFEKRRIKNKIPKPSIMEKPFLVKIFDGLPPFKIIPDAFFQEWKTVADWKTGNNVMMDDNLIVQGLSYMLGMRKEGYDVEKVLFVDLTKGKEPSMPIVTEGFLRSKAQQMCDMIRADNFPSKASYLCNWCEYRLSCDLRYVCPWELM